MTHKFKLFGFNHKAMNKSKRCIAVYSRKKPFK